MSDYLFDKQGEDPEVARLEQLLGGHAHRAPLRPLRPRRRRRLVAASTVLVAAAAAAAAFLLMRPSPAPTIAPELSTVAICGPDGRGFSFATEGGTAQCAGEAVGSGVLPVGVWLETSAEVLARLEIADIGDLLVHGGSRVRLVNSGADEHRLELTRGRVSAQVLAPPRLFVVDTPSATAVDLGCAYELAVTDDGTHLKVTSGAVSLEGHGRIAHVSAGHEVFAVRGRGPGTPLSIDADQALREAAARFDDGDSSALEPMLALAQRRDAITLWNLLGRTEDEAREAVSRRLDSMHRHPASVRESDILAGQPAALEAWRESIEAAQLE